MVRDGAPGTAGRVALSASGPFRGPGRRVGFRAMNPSAANAAKWVGATVGTILLALVIYLGAVVQVYLLAWVIEIIGRITG